MSARVALYLQDAHSIREGMEFAAYAEARGFEAVWQAESRLVREATVPLAAYAAVTDRITVASGVSDCWSRNPARLAATFSTLDDLAPGRVVLGLGAWWDPLAAKVGITRAHPLTVMREVVTAVRGLLANETVTFHGQWVHLTGVELDYVYQERRPKDVPVYVGATGDQMLELAGEIADGVVLNYLVSPDYNDRALEHLERGLARAGRTLDGLDRPQLVVCSVHEDEEVAVDMARLMVTQYLGQQPHIMRASGVPQSLLDAVGEVLTWPATHEQVEAASKLVPDEIVRIVECLAPVYGGINLEDIAAPRCFEVERRLRAALDIPVFHDDQHGTAVVVLAALTNALRVVGKTMGEVRAVVLGVGAAGVAITRLLMASGIGDVVAVDRQGILTPDMEDLDEDRAKIAAATNCEGRRGGLDEALAGADVFIGVSGPDLVSEAQLRLLGPDAIVFALANPDPEVDPALARRHAAIVATGRSDEPNQINNVLVFPGFFRGLLNVGAHEITEEMELAAGRALAAVVAEEELSPAYIIPTVFNPAVVPAVAGAVEEAARR